MTKQESINIYLTEVLFEKCWHDFIFSAAGYTNRKCKKCGNIGPNKDLFTPEGFFILWEKAQTQEWWSDFVQTQNRGTGLNWVLPSLVNYQTFPVVLAEYIGLKA